MKRILTMCLVACSAAVVGAQAGYPDKPQTDKTTKEGTMVVTGCIADKSTGGGYLLNNAMATPTSDSKPVADKDPMAKGTAGMHHAMSYELSGGENLQAHLGHKVEITGMLGKADWDRMKKMEPMAKPEKSDDKTSAGQTTKPMKLEVKSLKMISAVCP